MVDEDRSDGRSGDYDQVVEELRRLRKVGLAGLRRLQPRRLGEIAARADLAASGGFEPSAVEALLRRAVNHLGGGVEQEAAEYLFGLAQGWKMRVEGDRRKQAASILGIQADSFRKAPERGLVSELAEGVLAIAREADLRQTRRDLQQQRHPADSRLAVQWVERFEAYSRLWTPLWALAAELQAAVVALREEATPFPPWDPKGLEPESQRIAATGGYDPVEQSRSYARSALYRYATFQLELKRFLSRYGGLFLFSSTEVEEIISDAIYLVGWHTPGKQEADAWLRRNLADSRHEEQDHFEHLLATTTDGSYLLTRWYDFVQLCRCQDTKAGDLPAGAKVPDCDLHAVIYYCRQYCELVDDEWMKIADWYRLGSRPPRGVEAGQPYEAAIRKANG